MATDLHLRLSTLEPLATYLAKGADIDSGLLDALQDQLPGKPGKARDKLLKTLDALLQEPQGAQVLVLTLGYLLDEWLKDGSEVLMATSQFAEPFTWLAVSDHLETVQAFRNLL